MNTLGQNIGRRIRQLKTTQTNVAQAAGVSHVLISRLIKGDVKTSGKLPEIAEALGLSVEALVSGEFGDGPFVAETSKADHQPGLGLDSAPLGVDSNGGTIPTPIYDVEFAAGFGADAGLESEPEYLQIPAYYYTESGVFPGDGMIVTVRGDSMERTFYNGDKLMIDKSQTKPINDAVFAFNLEGDLRVKRFFRKLDGTWKISSDNKDDPAYEDEIISPDRLQFINIIGQVVALVHRPIRRI